MANLLLFPAQLLLLQAHALRGKLLGQDRGVRRVDRVHRARQLLRTVRLVQHIVNERLEVRKMGPEGVNAVR